MQLTRASLTDTSHCPVCGTQLPGPRCTSCGADLSGPDAIRLFQLSQRIAELLDHRAAIITTIQRQSVVPVAPGAPPIPAPAPGPAPAPPPPRPSVFARLGVHGVLLSVGALLLAAASIAFLLYSWRLMDLSLRATIIAGITAAVLVFAGRLKPKLPDAAEAIGALGVVLVLADAWAVRSTGLWGADQPATLAYTAGASAVCALVLAAWSSAFDVRAGSLSACVLGPLSLVLAGSQVSQAHPDVLGGQGIALGLIAGSALALARVALPHRLTAERALLLTIAAAMLPIGAITALGPAATESGSYGWASAVLVLAAALASVQASADRGINAAGVFGTPDREGGAVSLPRAWSGGAGVLLGLAAGEAGQAIARSSSNGPFAWIDNAGTPSAALSPWALLPMLLPMVVLVIAAIPAARQGLSRATAVRPGYLAGGVGVVAAALSAPATLHALIGVAQTVGVASPAWQHRATTAIGNATPGTAISSGAGWLTALGGLLVLAAGTAALHALGMPKQVRRHVLVTAIAGAGGGLLVLTLAPALPIGGAVLALLVIGAITAVAVPGYRGWPVSAVTITLATVLSWASLDLSPGVTLIAAGALLLARRPLAGDPRNVLLALAGSAAGLVAVHAGGIWLGLPGEQSLLVTGLLAAVLTMALIGSSRGPLPAGHGRAAWAGADRLAAAGPALAALLAACVYWWAAQWAHSGAGLASALNDPLNDQALAALPVAQWRAPVLTVALIAVAVLAVVRPLASVAARAPGLPATGAGVLVPLTGLLAVQLAGLGGLRVAACLVLGVTVAAAGVLITLIGLARTRPAAPRRAAEIGTLLTGLAALILAGQPSYDATGARLGSDLEGRLWLVLLLLGIGASAISTAADRIRVRWLAGLLLAGSSWSRLAGAGVTVVEAYTLPPAAVLLGLSLLHIRRTPTAAPRLLTQVATVALFPSILVCWPGTALRPALLLVTTFLLAILAIRLHQRSRAELAVALARVAMVTAAATGVVRGLAGVAGVDSPGVPMVVPLADAEVWTAPAGVVLLLIGLGIGWVFPRVMPSPIRESWFRTGPGLVLVLGPSLVLLLGLGATGAGPARIALLTALAGATLFLGAVRRMQAPVLIGAGVLIVDALVHLLPWVAQADLPPWVILAIVGLALVTLGATYEQRLRNLRDLRLRVAALT